MRNKLLAVGWVVALAAVCAIAAPTSASAGACPSTGYYCTWEHINYTGAGPYGFDERFAALGWYGTNGDRSAKNHFGARRVRYSDIDSGVRIIVGCLRADHNDPNLGLSIDQQAIGASGTGNDC